MLEAAGPVVDPVPCSGCGKLIDPLRAGHVAIFDHRFHYFCDRGVCRASFLRALGGEEAVEIDQAPKRSRPPNFDDEPVLDAFQRSDDEIDLPEAPAMLDDRLLVEPVGQTILNDSPRRFDAAEARDVGALLLVIAVVAGALAVALALAGDARLIVLGRIILAAVGAGMLLGRALTTPREPIEPHPYAILASSIVGLAVAAWAALGRDSALASEAASLVGLLVCSASVGVWLADAATRRVAGERAYIAEELDVEGRRVDEAGEAIEKSFELRSGEQVVVEPGETVPVDLIAATDVDVYPWIGAATVVRKRTGSAIVAGARVVRGRLRGTCTWSGPDRAFARTLLDPRRRADAVAPIASFARSIVERWAIGAALVAAISGVLARRNAIEVTMIAAAVHGALATTVIATIAAVHVARGILLGLRRGVVYKSADAWERAGRVGVAAFCARGTLLLGEPELAEVEATGNKLEPTDALSLAAGAARFDESPLANAILRAAKTRGVKPDGVRNPHAIPGVGITATSSSGEDLVVGTRALLIDQRISIAASESRIAELEAHGRAVVLVALGARLVGLLALQDGLRPGARAAVQHLLDAQIEPVLMSNDARETCEAIGRSLDIEHIRPEVLPEDRATEVRRLVDAGASVAVLGHPGADDAALGAADVPVALAAAGSAPGDYALALASDDVRDAALALALAHRTRAEARIGLGLAVVPALIGSVAIAFGFLPPAYAPLASLLGSAVAVTHLRSLARATDADE